jgi:hypothetical protein
LINGQSAILTEDEIGRFRTSEANGHGLGLPFRAAIGEALDESLEMILANPTWEDARCTARVATGSDQ